MTRCTRNRENSALPLDRGDARLRQVIRCHEACARGRAGFAEDPRRRQGGARRRRPVRLGERITCGSAQKYDRHKLATQQPAGMAGRARSMARSRQREEYLIDGLTTRGTPTTRGAWAGREAGRTCPRRRMQPSARAMVAAPSRCPTRPAHRRVVALAQDTGPGP